ncbi:MAG: PspA/IM30 family protein [Bacteroidales bacterium]
MNKMMLAVLAFLGLTEFAKKEGKNTLTDEQKAQLAASFGQEFADKFASGLINDFKDVEKGDDHAAELATLKAEMEANKVKLAALESDKSALESEKATMAATIAQQKAQIDLLADKPVETPEPIANKEKNIDVKNDKHLFGVNVPFMAIDEKHPYNRRAYAALMAQEGIELASPKHVNASLDYSSLTSDLGDYYRIRKQDRIQSFLMKLPSMEGLFPMESGYQDRAVLVNMFLEDFSQADNTSSTFTNVIKGGYKLEPEELRMFDVMFAYKFTDLKKLEKQWIGYLNREGSDTMKWSFIEYIMVETGKKLHNEREMRRVLGIRTNPTLNVAGKSMEASDGLLQFIKKQIDLFKIRPFAVGEWTETTISEYIRTSTALVPAHIRDRGSLVLYMSSDAVTAYHKNNETLYGVNQDYKAGIMYVKEYPNVAIKAIPNAGNRQRMIWTLQGNISLFEDQKGEMYNFNFEQEDWSLKVWSNWKESIWAYMVGKKHASLAAIPTDYSTQMIWCNDVDIPASYFVDLVADDVTPSVARHTSLVSVANTQATAITGFDDATVGVPITIKCGNATNGVTIAKSGNFSLITAAWSPAVGDTLTVFKRSDGKFIEINRTTATSNIEAFAADDTSPDLAGADTFIGNANTEATAITTFDNASYDKLYTVYGAGTTNASTIANSGNFVLTAAMTLSAGTFIKFYKSRTDDKFYEVSRG